MDSNPCIGRLELRWLVVSGEWLETAGAGALDDLCSEFEADCGTADAISSLYSAGLTVML